LSGNKDFANAVLKQLQEFGVKELVICPGARCAPILKSAQQSGMFKLSNFFDERSASFFALGRSKSAQLPVAVVTTSGSAVANCLPAITEAKYAGVPLIILSADRPKAARGTGAPQTMEQPGIFSDYVGVSFDYDFNDFLQNKISINLTQNLPAHINLCFDEPLLADIENQDSYVSKSSVSALNQTQKSDAVQLKEFTEASKKPLVILGPMSVKESKVAKGLLKNYNGPIYCEALSQLQDQFLNNEVKNLHLHLAKDILATTDTDFDGVIRVGLVPCLRYWRDLEKNNIPVINFSSTPYSGLARQSVRPLKLDDLSKVLEVYKNEVPKEVLLKDRRRSANLSELLLKYAKSELALVNELKKLSLTCESVFIGNSLAIREWDVLRQEAFAGPEIVGQRGLNGIDGLISHAMGHIKCPGDHLVVLGDLSALYDLNSLWALKHLPIGVRLIIAVINNSGGKIFKPMFNDPIFENQHQINFAHWAKTFALDYVDSVSRFNQQATKNHTVIELVPNETESQQINQALGSAL
jgi:2-succinyl-5-enolpyruvyl-6-hydroxy-3-cyclohexene-1-carboxylate synthase